MEKKDQNNIEKVALATDVAPATVKDIADQLREGRRRLEENDYE